MADPTADQLAARARSLREQNDARYRERTTTDTTRLDELRPQAASAKAALAAQTEIATAQAAVRDRATAARAEAQAEVDALVRDGRYDDANEARERLADVTAEVELATGRLTRAQAEQARLRPEVERLDAEVAALVEAGGRFVEQTNQVEAAIDQLEVKVQHLQSAESRRFIADELRAQAATARTQGRADDAAALEAQVAEEEAAEARFRQEAAAVAVDEATIAGSGLADPLPPVVAPSDPVDPLGLDGIDAPAPGATDLVPAPAAEDDLVPPTAVAGTDLDLGGDVAVDGTGIDPLAPDLSAAPEGDPDPVAALATDLDPLGGPAELDAPVEDADGTGDGDLFG